MAKNEDGEFELILGNRQLLSVFFIVVMLLGVFFTMGYIIGRNSSPAVSADSGHRIEGKPTMVEPTAVASTSTAQDPPTAAAPLVERRPTVEKPAPVRTEPTRTTAKPESASPTPDVPTPGASYLQVGAVFKPEAELLIDVLAKRGFHALYTPVPEKPTMYRVLVGPFQDTGAIAQARADLNKAGFKGFEALLRKY